MTTLINQLKELDAAGDKATKGEWILYGEPEVNMPTSIFCNHEDEKTMTEIAYCPYPPFDENFIIQSANSRPAIKAAIAELDAKDKEIERLRAGFLDCYDELSGIITSYIPVGRHKDDLSLAKTLREMYKELYTTQALGGNDE